MTLSELIKELQELEGLNFGDVEVRVVNAHGLQDNVPLSQAYYVYDEDGDEHPYILLEQAR